VKTYRAFISYNRGADAVIAEALARALTRFARPWYRQRAMRVFLDRTSLSTDDTLRGALERSLGQSEWMILLACPASAASPWVRREVEWWRGHRPLSRLIIVRTGGVIAWDGADGRDFDWSASTALSPALRGAYREEPLWADFEAAAAADRKTVADPVFRDAFLTVAAQLHGMSKDALWNAERVEQRKRVGIAGVATVLIAAFALGAYNQWKVSMDRKENLASIQLGAKAFMVLPSNPRLAARIALAGVALRPSGIAASALRSALARIAGPALPRRVTAVAGAVGLAFSPDTTELAVVARDGRVTVLEAARGTVARELPSIPGQEARALAWGADGTLAVAGAGGLRLWPRGGAASAGAPPAAVDRLLPGIAALAFAADGQRLALALADGTVHTVTPLGADAAPAFLAHPGGASAVAFTADGSRLATGGVNGDVALWETASARPLGRIRLPGAVASVDFNWQGGSNLAERMLALADRTGAVWVIDADAAAQDGATPARIVRLTPLQGPGVAARFDASGRCLVRAAAAAPVTVDATLGFDRLFELGAPTEAAAPVVAIAVAPTGHFAVLDAAGRVALYEQSLCGDAEAVCSFAAGRIEASLGRLTPQDRLRWVPADVVPGREVQQPPGPQCRSLIDGVLGPAPAASAGRAEAVRPKVPTIGA
jgi:hypothetical protein